MYLRYFGFNDHPFALTPDPGYLFLSPHHREALGHLVYGTGEHGGFVQLTGEVGTGKTTLIRALLEQDVSDVDVALCVNPRLTAVELLATICDELGIAYPRDGNPSLKTLVDRLNLHLLRTHVAGRRTVLIIDEAQDLIPEVLEQVRLLTNLETRKHKLLRIILVGQPELEVLLARPDLRQLAQRITARYHLRSLHAEETRAYVDHRITVAGGQGGLFDSGALKAVHRLSQGIPRLINIICERALLGAYSLGRRQIDAGIVRRAAAETQPRRQRAPLFQNNPGTVFAVGLVLIAVAVGGLAAAYQFRDRLFGGGLPPPSAAELDAARDMVHSAGPAEGEEQAPAVDKTSEADAASSSAEVSPSGSTGEARGGAAATVKAAETAVLVPDLPEGNAEMAQLLRMWGVFGATVNARCRGMQIGDLRCLQEKGSFSDLERFDRPALLELRQGNRNRRVLLSQLGPEQVKLVTPGGVVEWPREALARLWTGEYRLVWRLEAQTRRILPGSVGPSVVWLRRKLARAEGRNPDAQAGKPSPVFDEALADSLRRFQVTNGLKPDGVVGARTMILLNGVDAPPDDSAPRLRQPERN